jgi:SNF2 family DNA or RNA helicase
MSQSQRAKSVGTFNSDPKVRILLASLKAGGVGLNLVAASNVILVDVWWNPSIEYQAIDRVHRLGQVRAVHVFRFVCSESVEERMIELQAKKNNMSTQALSGGLGEKKDSSKLTMEELRNFFL